MSTSKMKYITNSEVLSPLEIGNTNMVYSATGELANNDDMINNYMNFNRVDIETDLRIPKCEEKKYYTCNSRQRNLDTSNYIYNGSHVNTGFGNIDVMNQMKFGINTRLDQVQLRDYENKRLENTDNYKRGDTGKMPYPEDTRYLNKKYYT